MERIKIQTVFSLPHFNFLFKDYVPEIRRCRRIILIGCGTSYNATVATRQSKFSHITEYFGMCIQLISYFMFNIYTHLCVDIQTQIILILFSNGRAYGISGHY